MYRKSCFLPVFIGFIFLLFLLFYNPLFLKVDLFFRVKNLTPTATNQSRVLNKHFFQYSYFLQFSPLSWVSHVVTFLNYLFNLLLFHLLSAIGEKLLWSFLTLLSVLRRLKVLATLHLSRLNLCRAPEQICVYYTQKRGLSFSQKVSQH